MKKRFIITCSCLFLASCGLLSEEEPQWVTYKDINNQEKEITAFNTKQISWNNDKRNEANYLEIHQRQGATYQILGAAYPLKQQDGSSMYTLFLYKNRSFNPNKPSDMKELKTANTFDFYEFGKLRISQVHFSSNHGICQDFKSKQGVNMKLSTNYYSHNNTVDFYTNLIQVGISNSQLTTEIDFLAFLTLTNKKIESQLKQEVAENGLTLAKANIREKASLLFMICNQ